MSITTTGIKNVDFNIIDSIFYNNFEKHSIYATEFKKINITSVYKYGQELSFKLNLNGDLLHRCFFQITLPYLKFTDNIINDPKYILFKNNKLNNILDKINLFTEDYTNFYNYSTILIDVYKEITSLYSLNNINLDFIKLKVNNIVNKNDNINNLKLLVDADIISQIDIINYVLNLNSLLDFDNIKININKMYNNILNYLSYYHSNKVYYENEYKKVNDGEIFYKWIDNLAHHYFTHFEFNLDGHIMDNYSNDTLHIYQTHNIIIDMVDNYNKMIGNSNNIYNKQSIIYTPLLFWFCKDISKSLPLVGLSNSNIKINTRINNLKNLIYFQDWEKYYNDIITLYIPRDEHNINNENNIISSLDLDYITVELLLPENIYKYTCKRIDKRVLDIKFIGINSDSILDNYGSIDENGKYLSLDDFIFLMNNIKTDIKLSESTKIQIADYHYFIDYNYLLNLIPPPKVDLLAEYCYVDDIEKKILATNRLNYLVEINNEVIIDINNNDIYDSINELNGLIKEMYYFSQKKIELIGYSKYGKSNQSNYNNDLIKSIELKINDNNIFENNDIQSYYLLLSQLPDGVKYTSFSLYPNDIQPSGSFNMSSIKGQNIEILLEDYNNKYYNKNSIFKLIYTKYNLFITNQGKGQLYLY